MSADVFALSLADLLDPQDGPERPDAWRVHAAPHQQPPDGRWAVWLMLGGRGAGKTWAGAHWLTEQVLSQEPGAWVVAAPTFRDCRNTCIEGESGLLAALGDHVTKYVRSLGELHLDNGATIYSLSADQPDRFRGGNYRGAWVDELAAWAQTDAWDQLRLATRRGDARIVATTTPRATPLIRGLVARDGVVTVRASTFDNQANLSDQYLDEVRAQYEGTRLGRQELFAEILDDVEGALWTQTMLDNSRVQVAPELVRVVVAVDPSGGNSASSDEQGIVAAGQAANGDWYVLADRSVKLDPHGWASTAVSLYDELGADRIVAEDNFGGQMVAHTLRTIRPDLPVKVSHAVRGKQLRAEPVVALYEQGRVHHVGVLPGLEDQMVSWVPGVGGSPDRVDALVWAVTELSQSAFRPPRSRFTLGNSFAGVAPGNGF